MICAFPPMNLVIFPFNILAKFTKDKVFLRRLDNMLMKLAYTPILILGLVIFIIGNLIFMPFAYLYTLFLKVRFAYTTNKNKFKAFSSALSYLLFGFIMLIVT